MELTANGTNYVALKAPSTLSSNYTYTLPNSYGTNGHLLQSDGNGGLSWYSVSLDWINITNTPKIT